MSARYIDQPRQSRALTWTVAAARALVLLIDRVRTGHVHDDLMGVLVGFTLLASAIDDIRIGRATVFLRLITYSASRADNRVRYLSLVAAKALIGALVSLMAVAELLRR